MCAVCCKAGGNVPAWYTKDTKCSYRRQWSNDGHVILPIVSLSSMKRILKLLFKGMKTTWWRFKPFNYSVGEYTAATSFLTSLLLLFFPLFLLSWSWSEWRRQDGHQRLPGFHQRLPAAHRPDEIQTPGPPCLHRGSLHGRILSMYDLFQQLQQSLQCFCVL